ncbi:MAG: cupredoxin domain-containing protein, partial [Propionibacteriaceae bacterium]|nr:cupredoxin domain-containing protein [Propionibacteriaceae bacterium]
MRAPLFAGLAVAALAISGCVANTPAPGTSGTPSDPGTTTTAGVLTVSSTDTECTLSANTAASGNTTFQISNDGGRITEFYLLGSDGLRIVAEKENIAPGSSAELSVALQPGSYFTACKPGMRGANVGEAAFTVTGDPIQLSGEDQELFAQAV